MKAILEEMDFLPLPPANLYRGVGLWYLQEVSGVEFEQGMLLELPEPNSLPRMAELGYPLIHAQVEVADGWRYLHSG